MSNSSDTEEILTPPDILEAATKMTNNLLRTKSRKMALAMKSIDKRDTYFYFAYGSNLLKKRIHITNPSAEFIGIGRLDDHQLDFMKYSPRWGGTSATIVPKKDAHVWGAVWRAHNKELPALDKQEGVDTNWYFAKLVQIMMNGEVKECRTYQQSITPPPRKDNEEIPPEERPSMTYLNVIINGAKDCQLPEDYIEQLKKIPHNGKEASAEMLELLKR